MNADEWSANVTRLLVGAAVGGIGRAASMGVIEFVGVRGEQVAVHAQCPFRLLQAQHLVLGSRDMDFPQKGAGPDAFDHFTTIYDSRAASLNAIFADRPAVVTGVTVGDAGSLAVAWQPDYRLELFADCSGSVESWRVFVRGGDHFGYPDEV